MDYYLMLEQSPNAHPINIKQQPALYAIRYTFPLQKML